MNDVSDVYNKRLLEYADKQEMFNIKEYKFNFFSFVLKIFNKSNRVTQQFTLDTIGSCLFGIETNSLQNENSTLVKHLKQMFSISLSNLMVIVFRN